MSRMYALRLEMPCAAGDIFIYVNTIFTPLLDVKGDIHVKLLCSSVYGISHTLYYAQLVSTLRILAVTMLLLGAASVAVCSAASY